MSVAYGVPSRRRRLVVVAFGLVYLVFPVMEIVTGKIIGARAVAATAALCAFTAAYLAAAVLPGSFGRPERRTYGMLALTALLGAGPALAFGGLTAGAGPGVVAVYGLQAVTLGLLFMGMRRSRLLAEQLREAEGEMARLAAADERLRIARDLHDLLGHSLSLIVLKAELAGRLAGESPKALGEIRDIEAVARTALDEVRQAVAGYRRRTLAEELDSARAVLRAAGVESLVRISGGPLPDPLDGLLGWAVREGVTNVVRHARAHRCEVEVTCDGGQVILDIVDDGRGGERHRLGSGLNGLAERVHEAGGELSAAARPQGGFRLRVDVPAKAAP